MKQRIILGVLGLVALHLVGCGPTIPQLRAQAASDMGCPSAELTLAQMKSKRMHVSGCGAEAIYAKACEEGEKCIWKEEKRGRTGEL